MFAIKTIRRHKGRTGLALLGVVIGVFSVVAVMTLGNGVKGYILDTVEAFGTDYIQVEVKVPNTGKTSAANATGRAQGIQITTMTTDDEEALARLPNVAATYSGTIGQERATYGSVGKQLLLFGTSAGVVQVDENTKIAEGRFYTESEDQSLARVIVIGSGVRETFFGRGQAIGESISIKGEKYRVIGVLEPRGAVAYFDLDAMAYVPVRTLEKKILGVDYVQFIMLKMADPSREDETVALVTDVMRNRHDIDDPNKDDFSVTSAKEAQDILGSIFGTITILLLALTSISLVVGGVGIMNVMYVSVAERTNEIGLRKAVGATSGSVLRQFLYEALIITGLGGILGILLGVLLSYAFSGILASLGFSLSLEFSAQTLLLGAGFSVAVGLIFGLSPAYRASRMTPMEALRKD